jgi:hypothetical protein
MNKNISKGKLKGAVDKVQTSVSKQIPKLADTPTQKPKAMKVKIQKKDKLPIPPEQETYFVYLKNPLEYRKHLLESSRKILFCLKSHQKIFLIRQKKLEEMRNLKASIKELLYLNKKFNDKLPKYHKEFLTGVDKGGAEKVVPKKHSGSAKPPAVHHEKTEMEKLEESLANIEKKLKTLQ